MSEFVLHASALLAFLKDEPGGSAVRPRLSTSATFAINLAEVATTFICDGMLGDEAETASRDLPIRMVPLDENQATEQARFGRLPLTTVCS